MRLDHDERASVNTECLDVAAGSQMDKPMRRWEAIDGKKSLPMIHHGHGKPGLGCAGDQRTRIVPGAAHDQRWWRLEHFSKDGVSAVGRDTGTRVSQWAEDRRVTDTRRTMDDRPDRDRGGTLQTRAELAQHLECASISGGLNENVDRAVAAEAETPHSLIVDARVVVEQLRGAGLDDAQRDLANVRFETSPAHATQRSPVVFDEEFGAGPAVPKTLRFE